MLFLSSSCVSSGTIIEKLNTLGKITKNIELSGGSFFEKNLLDNLIIEKDKGFNFLVHGYFPPSKNEILVNFADSSDETRNFIQESLNFCKTLEIPYYSVHAGFKKDYLISANSLIGGSKTFYLSGIEENINWFYNNYPELELAIENLYPVGKDVSTCFFMHPLEIIDLLLRFPKIKLLLDLGHLKVSGKYLDFDYKNFAEEIIKNFSNRIAEIHLSENNSLDDDHLIPDKKSFQYFFIRDNAELILNKRINLTIEARNCNINSVQECFNYFNTILS